jgi:hypothetical protein
VNGGGGITKVPVVTADSGFEMDDTVRGQLKSMGILAPIVINDGGQGYVANDTIVFTGGTGLGAFANVTSVNSTGAILNIEYVANPQGGKVIAPIGGMGYKKDGLPILSVKSANVQSSNAILTVPGILGDGAEFSVVLDRAGSVTTINLIDAGEDYVSTPKVSLKVHDILIKGVTVANLPQKGDYAYQGTNLETSSYQSRVDSIELVLKDNDPLESVYRIRLFNYNSVPKASLPIKVDPSISMTMVNYAIDDTYNANGIRKYGDGTAKANASFLNGLVISQGQYLNTQGQPSSFSVLQDKTYNNYTYEITVEKEISKYREVLLNLLHPTGMKVIGRNSLRSNTIYNYRATEGINKGYPLDHYTGNTSSSVTMTTDFTNKSTNILQFNNLMGANIASFINANSVIKVDTVNGPGISASIKSINPVSNTVTLSSNTWLTYPNVAYITANSGSNVINITSLTGAFDIINNGMYSNTSYPLIDVVFAGDKVLIANNTSKIVDYVDYEHDKIYLTSNLSSDANSLMSVNRTLVAQTAVTIFNAVGTQYLSNY